MFVSKRKIVSIEIDIAFILLYFSLYFTNCKLAACWVLLMASISYLIMLGTIIFMSDKKLNLCTLFLAISYLFYFGQYIELILTGKVENEALNITKSYSINVVNHISYLVMLYMHVFHIAACAAIGKFKFFKINNHRSREWIPNLTITNLCAGGIYIISYPFALYYQYTRYKYTLIWGYGSTLYEQFTSNGAILRIGEFLSGYVISMYILLILSNYKKKRVWIIIISIVPYMILYLLSGSRLQAILLIFVLILIKHTWVKAITKKEILLGFLGGVIVIYGLTISSSIRNYIGLYDNIFNAILDAFRKTSILDSCMHLFDEFGCQIVSITCVFENCPQNVSFNWGKLFLYGIEIIIPNVTGYKRLFYTDNTDDAFKIFLNNGNTGLGSSFISESYYCFGFIGIICVILLGWIIGKVSQKIDKKNSSFLKSFVYYYLAFCLIFTVRGDTFNIAASVVQYAYFPIIFIWLAQNVIRKKR